MNESGRHKHLPLQTTKTMKITIDNTEYDLERNNRTIEMYNILIESCEIMFGKCKDSAPEMIEVHATVLVYSSILMNSQDLTKEKPIEIMSVWEWMHNKDNYMQVSEWLNSFNENK
ncbi:hypothetical protein Barb6_01960 [Bacteroidales bacterium Barb6]|nr:hypothetical protein Barb6_01960 [Bacteroidales bacterium Barb6]